AEQGVGKFAIHAIAEIAADDASDRRNHAAQHAVDKSHRIGSGMPVSRNRGPKPRSGAATNGEKTDQQRQEAYARLGGLPDIDSDFAQAFEIEQLAMGLFGLRDEQKRNAAGEKERPHRCAREPDDHRVLRDPERSTAADAGAAQIARLVPAASAPL